MGQKKGQTGNPNGRGKGVPNKSTANAREAIAAFVDGNANRLTGWLDQIAEGIKHPELPKYIVDPDPKGAFTAMMSVIEFHIPKLARVEQSGLDGAPIEVSNVTQAILSMLTDEQLEQVMKTVGDSSTINHSTGAIT